MTEPNKPLEQMTAQERLVLGMSYHEQGRFDEAIKALSSIRRDDDPGTYAQAQFNLGVVYHTLDELEQAIKAWSNVPYGDNSGIYAWAQLHLGNTYRDLGELEQAIKAWSNVHYSDNSEAYADAQFNLGVTYHTQGEQAQAIKAWSNIHRDDNPQAYAKAQFNLGVTSHIQGELDQAITTWSNIHRDDDPKTYASAQLGLGRIYEDKGKIEQAKKAYRNARDFFYYKGERGYRILECPLDVIEKLRNMAINTDKVRESLQLIPEFESKVAHYSRPSTAFDLFEGKKNDKKPSNFRLSTIRGVNDPSEGLVLGDYWEQQGIPETIHANDTATFISCFTFNCDSLNQFHLYGKENGREATGVSLVFNKDFFSDQSDDDPNFIAGSSTDSPNKVEKNKSNEAEKPLLDKTVLRRCIYLDPKTGYWTLAQCDKSTFYHQYKKAKEEWGEYQDLIQEKEECIKKHLFGNNNSILSILKFIFKNPNTYSAKEKQKILEAVRFILLPLQYLVKHIAFQEEQECRIMYITHIHDEKVHSNWEKQWMYVEYEEPVAKHIDKIYLSPGAAKYQDHFRILLDRGSGENKVRLSQNPFRNKE